MKQLSICENSLTKPLMRKWKNCNVTTEMAGWSFNYSYCSTAA